MNTLIASVSVSHSQRDPSFLLHRKKDISFASLCIFNWIGTIGVTTPMRLIVNCEEHLILYYYYTYLRFLHPLNTTTLQNLVLVTLQVLRHVEQEPILLHGTAYH